MLLIIQHTASDYLYITKEMYLLAFVVCLLLIVYIVVNAITECEVHFWIEDKLQTTLCKMAQRLGMRRKRKVFKKDFH